MVDDYRSWYQQNLELIQELNKHDSIIYHRLQDVFRVMDYITTLKEPSEDLEVFLDTGFAYLYSKFIDITYYLDIFDNNILDYLEYETLINYHIYLDDLRDVIIDSEYYSDAIKKGFSKIEASIDKIIINKQKFEDKIIDEYNIILMSVIPSDKQFLTIPEIFSRAVEELNI